MSEIKLSKVKLYYGVYKLNEKGKLQTRVFILDFKEKELLNTHKGSLKRVFDFADIASVKLSKDSPLCLFIKFSNHGYYEIHCQTPTDSHNMKKILEWIINSKYKAHKKEIIAQYNDTIILQVDVDKQGSMKWSKRQLCIFKDEIRVYKKNSAYPVNVMRILPCIIMKIGRTSIQISSKLGFKHFRVANQEIRDRIYNVTTKLKRDLNEVSLERSRSSVRNILEELVREVLESEAIQEELKYAFTGADTEMELVSTPQVATTTTEY